MSCCVPNCNLSICAGPFPDNAFHMLDFPMISKLLNFFGEKLQHLVQQLAFFHFAFATEVDHFAVKTIAAGAPSIFVDQSPRITAEGDILPAAIYAISPQSLA